MLTDFLKTYNKQIEWALGIFVVVTAVVVWVEGREVGEEVLSIYDIFPVFGLMAFGLMWTHFVMGALRRFAGVVPAKENAYKTVSMGMVLGLIILHPTLLWIGLARDGFGPPPFSHILAYEDQLLYVGLGTIGLTIFLAFELKRWFGGRKWWKWIEWAQIVGMTAIFFHAIELGNELREDWYMTIWWGYGITLAAAIIYTMVYNKRKGKEYGTEKV